MPTELRQPNKNDSKLRQQRLMRGMSLETASAKTGIAASLLSRYETGVITPTLKRAEKLAKFFDLDPLTIMRAE